MIDDNKIQARYIKLSVTGTEKSGMIPAVWNLKVYDSLFEVPSLQNEESITSPGVQSTGSLLVDFNVDAFKAGSVITKVSNKGKLGGHFETNGSLVV